MRARIFLTLSMVALIVCGCHSGSDDAMIFPNVKKGKIGFVDGRGKVVIPHNYDGIEVNNDGLIKMRLGSACGMIDTNGSIVLPCRFDTIVEQVDSLFSVEYKSVGISVVSPTRVIFPFGYYEFVGDSMILKNGSNILFHVRKDGMQGVIDINRKEIIPIEYTHLESFRTGNNRLLFFAIKDGRWFILDEVGSVKKQFRESYANMEYIWGDSLEDCFFKVSMKGMTDGLITFDEKVIIPTGSSYDNIIILPTRDKKLLFFDGKRVLNSNGECVLDIYCSNYGIRDSGLYNDKEYYVLNTGYDVPNGLFSETGEILIPFEYYSIAKIEDSYNGIPIFRMSKDNKWMIMGLDGKVWLETEVPIRYLGNCLFAAGSNKQGVIDINNKPIIPNEYDRIDSVLNIKGRHYFKVVVDGASGIVDENNKAIIPIEHESIVRFGNVFIVDYRNVYNKEGKKIIDVDCGRSGVKSYGDLLVIRHGGYEDKHVRYTVLDGDGKIVIRRCDLVYQFYRKGELVVEVQKGRKYGLLKNENDRWQVKWY